MFLNENDGQIPFAALKYLTAECNYGGRVTDDKDRRLITTLLNDYYCLEVVKSDVYKYAPDPLYRLPECETHAEYIEFINNLPI